MFRCVLCLCVLGILISVLCPAASGAATQPNIILVTVDSARADRMGFLGYHGGLTPHLDDLARQSIVFERAYAQAPLTVVSSATILSGTYPQTNQASELGTPLPGTLPYLPDLLRARGYRTAAFVGSAALDPREGMAPGFDRGFDVFDAPIQNSFRVGGGCGAKLPGDQVAARAIKWLSGNGGRPFFLWIHLSDADASCRTSHDRSSYDHGVASADAALGKLVAELRMRKLFEDSLMVIVADHGESLGAHGEDSHGIFLYDETIHVPLLVKMPQEQLAGKRVKGRVRLLDIAPTVLERAGVSIPSQMQGQSLVRIAKTNPDADQSAYARSDFSQEAFGWSALESWRAGKFLYIRAPQAELYDLVADPGAGHNLAQISKATLAALAAQLEAFDSHFGDLRGKSATEGLSSSEMQKLASLGYVGLQKTASASNAAVTGTDPKDEIATANRVLNALASISEGKPDRAIAVLEQAVAAAPNMYLAQYALGAALAEKQRYAQAIEHLHKAIELRPGSAWAQYEMGASLVKTGDFKTAAAHLELALVRLPEFREAHLLLAQCYEHLGQTKQAQVEKQKATR